jgi:quercetin dioxygenase-like cupin family protein
MVDCGMALMQRGIVRIIIGMVASLLLLAVSVSAAQPGSLPFARSDSWVRIAAAQPAAQASDIESVILATRFLDYAPLDLRWVLRRGHPLNGAAHAHADGFMYAAAGNSYLVVVDSQGSLMGEGQAGWAPGGIGHLHTAPFRATSSKRSDDEDGLDIWTILLETDNDARRPGAAAISPPARGLIPGPYEARLIATTFQPGATTSFRQRTGPELAFTLSGKWELEYLGVPFALRASQGYFADPGAPHRLRNVGTSPARILSAQLAPSGQPYETSTSSP